MWLYNRDKTLGQCESDYNTATQDACKEAIENAVTADDLSEDDIEALKEAEGDASAMADILRDMVRENQDAFERHVNEDADSAVTYTADSQLMLLMTNNEGAYEDEIGEKPSTLEAQAAFAYAVDVREWLDNDYFMDPIATALLEATKKASAT